MPCCLTSIGPTVFQRDDHDEDWRGSTLTEAEALRMPEIGIDIPIDKFHAGVEFPSAARGD